MSFRNNERSPGLAQCDPQDTCVISGPERSKNGGPCHSREEQYQRPEELAETKHRPRAGSHGAGEYQPQEHPTPPCPQKSPGNAQKRRIAKSHNGGMPDREILRAKSSRHLVLEDAVANHQTNTGADDSQIGERSKHRARTHGGDDSQLREDPPGSEGFHASSWGITWGIPETIRPEFDERVRLRSVNSSWSRSSKPSGPPASHAPRCSCCERVNDSMHNILPRTPPSRSRCGEPTCKALVPGLW